MNDKNCRRILKPTADLQDFSYFGCFISTVAEAHWCGADAAGAAAIVLVVRTLLRDGKGGSVITLALKGIRCQTLMTLNPLHLSKYNHCCLLFHRNQYFMIDMVFM